VAPPYRVVLQRRAFEQLRRLQPAERQEAVRMLDELRADPSPDGGRKRILRIPPDVLVSVYDGDLIWITYHVIDLEIISVLACVAWGEHRPRLPGRDA
jgi:hypothetical protein